MTLPVVKVDLVQQDITKVDSGHVCVCVYSRGSQRVCLGTLVCREISGLCCEKRYWESANT
jgi:hypothetical protein